MDRRTFMAATAGGALAGMPAVGHVAGPRERADAPAAGRIETYVTNLRDHRGPGPDSVPGTRLSLARMADRAYDRHSIAVVDPRGRRLGFLPASQSRVLAPLMDAGLEFDAVVNSNRGGANPALAVALTLRDPINPA